MPQDTSVRSCHGCGHRFYNDTPLSDGRCKYCHEDGDDPCIYCGGPATCSSSNGYGHMCHSRRCHQADEVRAEADFLEKYWDE